MTQEHRGRVQKLLLQGRPSAQVPVPGGESAPSREIHNKARCCASAVGCGRVDALLLAACGEQDKILNARVPREQLL